MPRLLLKPLPPFSAAATVERLVGAELAAAAPTLGSMSAKRGRGERERKRKRKSIVRMEREKKGRRKNLQDHCHHHQQLPSVFFFIDIKC